ncbi:MAG: DUF6015 family protein [Candidatus Nanopusillus acidilobi]
MEDDIYFVCIFCGAKARTREGLKVHTRIYHGQHEFISLNEIIPYVDKQIEKMKMLERQGKYDPKRIVEDDPAVIIEMQKSVEIVSENQNENEDLLITNDVFAKAIKNSFASAGMEMDYNDALQIAEHLLNFFGYDDAIIENYFETDDRQILYQLEDFGLVRFETSEYSVLKEIFSSDKWKTIRVALNYSKILEMANKVEQIAIEKDAEKIYEKLPEEVWIR